MANRPPLDAYGVTLAAVKPLNFGLRVSRLITLGCRHFGLIQNTFLHERQLRASRLIGGNAGGDVHEGHQVIMEGHRRIRHARAIKLFGEAKPRQTVKAMAAYDHLERVVTSLCKPDDGNFETRRSGGSEAGHTSASMMRSGGPCCNFSLPMHEVAANPTRSSLTTMAEAFAWKEPNFVELTHGVAVETLPDNLQITICKYLDAADIVNAYQTLTTMEPPPMSLTLKGILSSCVGQMEWVDAENPCVLCSTLATANIEAESVAAPDLEGKVLCKAVLCYQEKCRFPLNGFVSPQSLWKKTPRLPLMLILDTESKEMEIFDVILSRACRLHRKDEMFANLHKMFQMAALQIVDTYVEGSSQDQKVWRNNVPAHLPKM
ncbi:unnamed protein product [Taenia asiatica]|uniref:F-box domain-containing protein n=1 Tax=Taenia asiatica TaxID=60517 RepID=A0A0R3VY53_TAEAS|nr:unnamed protein product [Taenia asiatica]